MLAMRRIDLYCNDMNPKAVALFEGEPNKRDTIVELLHRYGIEHGRIHTADNWTTAEDLVSRARQLDINLVLLDNNLDPYKHSAHRTEQLLKKVQRLQPLHKIVVLGIAERPISDRPLEGLRNIGPNFLNIPAAITSS